MQGRTHGLTRRVVSLIFGLRMAGFLCLTFLLLAPSARAQVSTASVNGVIRDPKAAVISGATIVLRNVETSVERTSVSNNAGEYVILNITPGRYTLQANASGFNPQKTAELVLTVDQIATFDFSLAI